MKFHNTYRNLPSDFFRPSMAAKVDHPELLCLNESLAHQLGFDFSQYSKEQLAQIFSGQIPLEGSEPMALAYAGHQFGHFVPSLGDGRALLLGEVVKEEMRFDVQLKGSGQTFFSRRGDGKSALGPVLREYILSESMHSLNIPTTRAFAAVATNEHIQREEVVPGGIFTRVALSHIRIGTFQYFAARNEKENLKQLLHYTIDRHFQHLKSSQNNDELVVRFLEQIIENQTTLVSLWTAHGFIHGVMNTDNMSIALQTIDYGPCAFMDYFNSNQVYSYIDRQGRYAYSNQPKILSWNLARLADCLIPLFHASEDEAISRLNQALQKVPSLFTNKYTSLILKKLGLEDREENISIIESWFDYLEEQKLDFTLAFRHLSKMGKGDLSFYPRSSQFSVFYDKWKVKAKTDDLNSINPIFIPRNHVIEDMIKKAYSGDFKLFHELIKFSAQPFVEIGANHPFYRPPASHEVIKNTFCGT